MKIVLRSVLRARMCLALTCLLLLVPACTPAPNRQTSQPDLQPQLDKKELDGFKSSLSEETNKFLQVCLDGKAESWSTNLKDPWGNSLLSDSSVVDLVDEEYWIVELRSMGPNRKNNAGWFPPNDDIVSTKTNWKTPTEKGIEWDSRLSGLWQEISTEHFIEFKESEFATFQDLDSVGRNIETNGISKLAMINDSMVVINEVKAYRGKSWPTQSFQFTGKIDFRPNGLIVIMPISYPIQPPKLGITDIFPFEEFVLAKADPTTGVGEKGRIMALEAIMNIRHARDKHIQAEDRSNSGLSIWTVVARFGLSKQSNCSSLVYDVENGRSDGTRP
jgi:hypothetical protein